MNKKKSSVQRLTNKSLHLAHSLNFYKRTQRPFVQLIACTHSGLKQVPSCRACRQSKTTSSNGTWKKHSISNGSDKNEIEDVVQMDDNEDADDDEEDDENYHEDDGDNEEEEEEVRWTKSKHLDKSGTQSGRLRKKNVLLKRTPFKQPLDKCSVANHSTELKRTKKKNTRKSMLGILSPTSNTTNEPVSVFCRFWGFRK